jgi:hypothetical protein
MTMITRYASRASAAATLTGVAYFYTSNERFRHGINFAFKVTALSGTCGLCVGVLTGNPRCALMAAAIYGVFAATTLHEPYGGDIWILGSSSNTPRLGGFGGF